MKKTYTLIFAAAVAGCVYAQTEAPTMVINLKNGSTVEYSTSDVKEITFRTDGEGPVTPPAQNEYAVINVPTNDVFGDHRVQKVMYKGTQIAEIDLEYIKSIDAQRTVIYPMTAEGRADLTKGLSTAGETVVWDATDHKATVTAGGADVKVLYYANGELTATEPTGTAVEATLAGDELVDKRGVEIKKYPIVKIGTQYWTTVNLQATRLTDGTPIASYASTAMADFGASSDPACHVIGDSSEDTPYLGLSYNGWAIQNEKFCPDGWTVGSMEDWQQLKAAGGSTPNYRSTIEWAMSGAECTNLNGFNAAPTGQFIYADEMGDTDIYTECYWWTNTEVYDALSKTNCLVYCRLSSKAKNLVCTDLSPHSKSFGHTVRLLRK